jgi:hypothetical protein
MNNTLKLQTIFQFSEEEVKNVRVRFSMPNGEEDPKDIYLKDPEIVNTKWFLHSGKKYNNFKPGTLAIHLLLIDKDLWLMTAVKKIISVNPPTEEKIWDYTCYKTEDVSKFQDLCGRTYISYHKSTQSGKYKWSTVSDKLIISKIDNEQYGENTFTSYRFDLPFDKLERIIKTGRRDWINALKHIQAVYLITDNLTGKFYVGSATSQDEFLLGRWKTYIKNGHGGNVKFKELIEKNGISYIRKNFSYRILDYFSESYPSVKVLESESYWKEVFKSRIFGYNAN